MNIALVNGVRGGHRPMIVGLMLCAAFAAASCARDPADLTHPTALSQTQVAVSTVSSTVVAQPVNNFLCPSIAPFIVPIVVVVRPNGTAGLVVTQVRLRFTDVTNRQMPQVTLPAPLPVTQFGDALTASRDSLTFPLSLGVGCGIGPTGTVIVLVDTRDGLGRMSTAQLSVNVR
jgi:hypothetical protein